MSCEQNQLGQPLGRAVPHWRPRELPWPTGNVAQGRFCQLLALNPTQHAASLFAANSDDVDGRMWTYLPYGPFDSRQSYRAWLDGCAGSSDPLFLAVIDQNSRQAVGVAAYLRIDAANGTVEVGHLAFSPLLQRKPAATEAMYLMMRRAFELGYRRYEWKCNSLNTPSRVAAQRLGFSFEGIFRQAAVVKGHSRDTAWYSITDAEWPALEPAFTTWLAPENFSLEGRQRQSLSDLTRPLLAQRG